MHKEIKIVLEKMADENYEKFIKALISFEMNIDDEVTLDKLYEVYMENDEMMLLNEGFEQLS